MPLKKLLVCSTKGKPTYLFILISIFIADMPWDAFKETAKDKELQELEEEYFRRKQVTKADKRKLQKRIESQFDVLAVCPLRFSLRFYISLFQGVGDYSDTAVFDEEKQSKEDQEYLLRKRMKQQMDALDKRKVWIEQLNMREINE